MNAAHKLAELLFDDTTLMCMCTNNLDDSVHMNLTFEEKDRKGTEEILLSEDPDFDPEVTWSLMRKDFEGKVTFDVERQEFKLEVDEEGWFFFSFYRKQEFTVIVNDVIEKRDIDS